MKLGCRPARNQVAFLVEPVPQAKREGPGVGGPGIRCGFGCRVTPCLLHSRSSSARSCSSPACSLSR